MACMASSRCPRLRLFSRGILSSCLVFWAAQHRTIPCGRPSMQCHPRYRDTRMPPHSAAGAWRPIPGFPQLVRPSCSHGPRATAPARLTPPSPSSRSPAAPIAWARPWVSLTLTLLTSESKSKSRDVETRQSRPSLAELSWPTCPLILFNFIVSLLGCSLLPSPFLRLPPSLTHLHADWHSRGALLPQVQPVVSTHKPAIPTHIPTPLTRAGLLHRTIYT